MPLRVKAKDEESRRILQAAADGDLEGYIRELSSYYIGKNALRKANRDLLKVRCVSGCTPLHYAAGGGHEDVMKYMLLMSDNDKASSNDMLENGFIVRK